MTDCSVTKQNLLGGQEMSRKFKATILLSVILLGVVGFISGCSKSGEKDALQIEENYIPVEVEAATIGDIEDSLVLNGKVVAENEIMIIPKAMGTVTNVNVKLGDRVKEGDLLFTIDKNDIEKGVKQASNGVDLARKSVAQAENGLNMAKINFELNSEKIENAILNLDRMEELYKEGAISKSQLEQTELAASEKNLEALNGQLKQAEIAFEQSQNQLKQAEISYEQAKSGLDNTDVKAPIGGIISSFDIKKGQIATSSQPAATIVDLDRVFVQISVVEKIINKLNLGQNVKINIPSAFDEVLEGTIEFIGSTPDLRSQLYNIRIYLENESEKIKPGMSSEVLIDLEKIESATIVKSSAILNKDGRNIVFIVEDNKAIEREVTLGLDNGEYVEIKSGISKGDLIIIEGQHFVENGGNVKVVRGE